MQTSRHALRLHAPAVPLLRHRRFHPYIVCARLASSSTDPISLNEVAEDVQEVDFEQGFLEGGRGIPAVKDSNRPGIIKKEIERVKYRRQRREENRRKVLKERFGNDKRKATWRHCLALLKNWTAVQHSGMQNLQITGPSPDLDLITYGLRDHASLRLMYTTDQIGQQQRSIMLSGHRKDLQSAVSSLGMHLVPSEHEPTQFFITDQKLPDKNESDTDIPKSLPGELDKDYVSPTSSNLVHIDRDLHLVPKYIVEAAKDTPPKWTEENFITHVRHMTRLRLPRSGSGAPRRLYAIEFIRRHLWNTIHDGNLMNGVPITTESLNLFIRFLHARSPFSGIELFNSMESFGCKPNANTYVLFVKRSAKAGNVQSTYQWLLRMVRNGISPNLEAWAAVYEIIPDVEYKQRLALETLRYNLVRSQKDVQIMIKILARVNTGSFLDSGGSMQVFYDALQVLFGRTNLHSATYRFMIDQAALRGRLKDAVKFLEYLRVEKKYKPTTADVNVLLSHCAIQENIGTAVGIIYIAAKRWGVYLDQETFTRLFRCFNWTGRYYNCLRVVWKVACLWKLTTLQMRRRVLRSLRFARDLQSSGREFFELPQAQRWENNFGRFVCDVSCSLSDMKNNPQKEIHEILRDDFQLGTTHRFTGDFAHLLLKAYQEDAPLTRGKWRGELRDGANLYDLVKVKAKIMEIPMYRKEFPLPHPKNVG